MSVSNPDHTERWRHAWDAMTSAVDTLLEVSARLVVNRAALKLRRAPTLVAVSVRATGEEAQDRTLLLTASERWTEVEEFLEEAA